MTSTFSYAPYNTSYEQRTPYLTPDEYTNAPTSVDVTNLIVGTAQANATALQETINRASSWVDQYTCGAWGSLASTVEVENARVWGSYRGTLLVHPKYWPITEVRAFAYSAIPGGLSTTGSAASITPQGNVTVYPQQFEVALAGTIGWGLGAPAGIARGIEYDTQYTYLAGWPNTTLAASVAAGAQSIMPTVINGIYPNTLLNIYDLPNDEAIQVSPSYVTGASVVPLVSPLQYSHATTATVTNLPPAIKQAAIWATTAFIKQRGSGALVVQDIGEVTRTQTGFSQDSGSDMSQAMMLLRPFRQVYVGWA